MKRTPLRRTAPLARGTSRLARGAIRKVNAARVAKKAKAYRQRLASASWQALRRQAYDRDGGLCWCPMCVTGRQHGEAFAFEPIPIWFDTKGKIHGFHTHHVTYARFGHEDLADLLTMAPTHHQALEAQMGYRQRWLRTR
jgi:hypothetical protein